MKNLSITEIKSFVPAKDYAISKQFYQALGFEMASDHGEVAYFKLGNCAFLLQDFYQPEHCNNYMMHLLVEDVASWYQQVVDAQLVEKFGAKVSDIVDQPWKIREFCLIDPSGVLWRIGQNI